MRWQRNWCLTEARAIILQAALQLLTDEAVDVMRTKATIGWYVECLERQVARHGEPGYKPDKAIHVPEDSDAPHFPPRKRG